MRLRGFRNSSFTALVVSCLALVAGVAHARSFSSPRYDVQVAIQPDGSLIVREDVQFRFEGGPFRRVFREIPARRTDGIVDVVATLNDERLPEGTGERQVEIDTRSDRTRIVWHLPPTADATVRLGLTYRARGVAERRDGSDRVAWTVLPRQHDYRIDASRTTITWPAGMTPFDTEGARQELWRETGERRIASPVIARSGDTSTIDVGEVRKDASYVVSLRFPPGALTPQLSQWQRREAERAAAGRGLVTGAALIALLGGAFVLFLWARSPRGPHERAGTASPEAISPDARPVAIASALRTRAPGPRRQDVLPTLLDVARRGALRFEADPTRRWSVRKYRLVRDASQLPAAQHERILLDALFEGGATTQVDLSKVWKRTSRRWKDYQAAVTRELVADGLMDPDRLAARRWMQVFGVCVLGAGLVALILSVVLLADRLGGFVVLPAVAVIAVAAMAFIAANRLSPLTDRGEREGARWRAMTAGLREIAKGDGTLGDPERVERWLPFAAAAGVGVALATRAHREGRPLPAWFRAAADDHGHAGALAAMLSSSAAATGSHGTSGGGAAGGGSSGAN